MSWSVSALGKAPAVAASIADQFSKSSPCVEPEESVRQAAAVLIATSLKAQGTSTAIKVTAAGSQSHVDYSKPEKGVQNFVNMQIEPQYGFVE